MVVGAVLLGMRRLTLKQELGVCVAEDLNGASNHHGVVRLRLQALHGEGLKQVHLCVRRVCHQGAWWQQQDVDSGDE